MRTNMKYVILLLLLAGCVGKAAYIAEEGKIDAYFCTQDNCTQIMHDLIQEARDIKCALYRIDEENLEIMKDVELILDGDTKIKTKKAKLEKGTGLMHNKFCVFDKEKVIGYKLYLNPI